jgi:hypothetical protein
MISGLPYDPGDPVLQADPAAAFSTTASCAELNLRRSDA